MNEYIPQGDKQEAGKMDLSAALQEMLDLAYSLVPSDSSIKDDVKNILTENHITFE